MMPYNEQLAANIRRIRREQGLTQVQASQRAGVTQSSWSDYESGRIDIRISSLAKIAVGLDVPIIHLLILGESST